MKKIIFILTLFIGSISMLAQNLDQYKYVIVPEEFEFSKEVNQYQLNALTKFLFEKNGFETLMRKAEKPVDLQENYCLALNARVIENSNLFVTKLVMQLEDCHGNIVFETKEGRSREKEFKTAHHEALRDAFDDIEELNYQFNPSEAVTAAPAEAENKSQSPAEAEVSQIKTPKTTENAEATTTAPTEAVAEKPSAKILNFERDGKVYLLKKSDSGYSFFQQNSEEPFAVLAKSGGENSFIYKSLTHQGVAYFDENGNLVVEYLNADNKSVKLVYKAFSN